jgi:Spy/CpxP family protein refolding chaperone
MHKFIFVALLVALSPLAQAQQELIELARQDIRAGRMGMVIASMDLTQEQREKFWPVYRDYAAEQEELLDRRIAMLKEFAANWDSMDDAGANSIAKQSFAIQRSRLERRIRYFERMSELLGPVLAVRFLQVDGQISTLLDFEMMQLTPLIQPEEQAAGK